MELYQIIGILDIIIALIAISIASIALLSYIKVRQWRLLFLSAAFFLLFIPHVLKPVVFSGFFTSLSAWDYDIILYVWFLFDAATVVPFGLLAYLYFDERKTQSVRITRSQWIIGGLLLLAEVAYIATNLLINYTSGDPGVTIIFDTTTYLFLTRFILNGVSYVLIILIVISLFSYYRAKRKKNTLVVMIGFIFLLISHFITSTTLLMSADYSLTGLATSVELLGYIAFLAALVRMRVLR